ncbi:hypothetical protein LNI95_11520 [Tenacibaculum dicentrarchi]|nr:hypothetical protein [Tenacibaculum dicentrarchi]
MSENKIPKTFEDFGLKFKPNEDCITCNTGSCHNNVTSKKDGKEYNVHITVNFDSSEYYIMASENASAESSFDIFEIFKEEAKAVKFVCDRFNWFNCF